MSDTSKKKVVSEKHLQLRCLLLLFLHTTYSVTHSKQSCDPPVLGHFHTFTFRLHGLNSDQVWFFPPSPCVHSLYNFGLNRGVVCIIKGAAVYSCCMVTTMQEKAAKCKVLLTTLLYFGFWIFDFVFKASAHANQTLTSIEAGRAPKSASEKHP